MWLLIFFPLTLANVLSYHLCLKILSGSPFFNQCSAGAGAGREGKGGMGLQGSQTNDQDQLQAGKGSGSATCSKIECVFEREMQNISYACLPINHLHYLLFPYSLLRLGMKPLVSLS